MGHLDEKGFKTAIIDDNLAIAGELTWQEIVEPVEALRKLIKKILLVAVLLP